MADYSRLSQSDLLGRPEPIVVLGDAGMGKTTLLEEIGQALGYKFVHARRLVRSLDPSKLLGDATTFVIDALDELAVQAEGDAVDKVLETLEKAGRPNFIISCRVADWRSATSTQAVGDTYGLDTMELFLKPVSRDEARKLLSNDIGDQRAETVLAHFENKGLEELFGNPQTLKLISVCQKTPRQSPTSWRLSILLLMGHYTNWRYSRLVSANSRPDPLRSAISALFDHRWEYPLVPAIGGSDQAVCFRLPQAARRCCSRAC